ncbi:MAG: hypothetical protein RQ767_04910, partial [Thermovirgaceae bacterium]|nr:hypothetical protein [Thermovirgaceae bacterium]
MTERSVLGLASCFFKVTITTGVSHMLTDLPRIRKDLENLARFNATPGKGLTRFSLTSEDRGARNYLKDQLGQLDVKVYEDAAGSLFGRREGADPSLPPIMVGSHF